VILADFGVTVTSIAGDTTHHLMHSNIKLQPKCGTAIPRGTPSITLPTQ